MDEAFLLGKNLKGAIAKGHLRKGLAFRMVIQTGPIAFGGLLAIGLFKSGHKLS